MSSPPPSSTGTRRWGLLGGSFDPVHRGHLAVARAAREAHGLQRVLLVPAAHPPHKPDRVLAPARDRVAMLELAVADEPGFVVETLELERPGPSYTVDTVRDLLAREPNVQLFLLIGSDNLAGLPRWHAVEELLGLVVPVVLWRAGDRAEVPAAVLAGLSPAAGAKVEAGFLALPPVPGRSTDIRAALAEGRLELPDLSPGVREYVRRRGLYGTHGSAGR